ncbi:PAS domain S-box protein [Maridesulfovibrio sp.]|uniref:PAS domain-containing hybrid sensor histidine kinase/response regulator n=1 Tax=Maridesulfovibrio sp. TaxID=2795000 RepID=UPI0029F4DAB6|nr:PAS domain S-box protein [Maridesulfovibrio sp.]
MAAETGSVLELFFDKFMITGELLFIVILMGLYLVYRIRTESNERRVIETALAASEKKFRMAFDSSPYAFSITTLPGGIYVDVNQWFTHLIGYDSEEVLGKSVLELNIWRDTGVRDRLLERLKKDGFIRELEAEFRAKDGSTLYGSLTGSIVDLDGVPHVIAMIRDISAQVLAEKKSKELEEELAKQEESQRLIVESSTNLFYSHDVDGRLTYVSPQSEVYFECSPEEAKVNRMDFATDNPINKKAHESIAKAIVSGKHQPPYEFEVKGKNGKVTLTEVREAPVVKDGRTVAIVGSLADITERKRIETILNNEVRFLDDLLKAIPVSIGVKDENGVFISCNPAYAKAVGFSMEEVVGSTTEDIYPQEISDIFAREDALVISSGKSRIFELSLLNRDGEQKTYHFMKTPFLGIEGKHPGVISVGIDMTERKQTELALVEAQKSAEKANKAKSLFLANMSHEIRTPINGLMGVLQLVEMSNIQGELKPFLNTALQSTRRLNRVLTDILDLSKVEAGKFSINDEVFEPAICLNDIIQLFEPMAAAKGISLGLILDPKLPINLVGDNQRLQQVLSNLTGNAIKFTSHGGVVVEVSVLESFKENWCRLLFSITDTGIGIAPDMQDKLFNAFVQGHEEQQNFGGTGLGLVISRKITELMGGSMALESDEGKGSTFYVQLSFEIAALPEKRELSGQEDFSHAGLRILLADDDGVSRQIASLLLEKMGCKVQAVENGEKVLSALENGQFDLALVDIQMPVMGGVEAAKEIRAGRCGDRNINIPIIALTACAMSGDRERFLKAGMSGYVEKPLEIKRLVTELKRFAVSR